MIELNNGCILNQASELGRDSECDKRRGNKPKSNINKAATLQDILVTLSQSKKTRALHAIVRQAEMAMRVILNYNGHVRPSQAPLAQLGPQFQLKRKHTNNDTNAATTQQSTKDIDSCASSLSNTDASETTQRMNTDTTIKQQS